MKSKKIVKLVLELNKDEAEWLHSMTQNYMGDPFDEVSSDMEIRQAIFNATDMKED